MSDKIAWPPIMNHDEAKELAAIQAVHSNMARCYLDLAARLAEAERRATTLQADLDRAITAELKSNAICHYWRQDWKAAIRRAEAAEARVRELEDALRDARSYVDGAAPSWHNRTRETLSVIDAALGTADSARTALDNLHQMDHEDSKT